MHHKTKSLRSDLEIKEGAAEDAPFYRFLSVTLW
jgi:hypothetical protein